MRSIAATLFFSIMLTVSGVVLALAVMFRISLGEGFIDYVAKLELDRLDEVEIRLVEQFRRDGNLARIRGARDLAPMRAGSPEDDAPPRPDGGETRGGPDVPPPPPPPPAGRIDRLGLGPRLALYDASGRRLFGAPESARRPKRAVRVDGTIIAYLGLAPVHDEGGGLAQQFLHSQTRNLLLIALIAVAVSAVVAIWLARYFRRPIAALSVAARELAAGRLDSRVNLQRADELGALADDFNIMANKLERFELSRRQWVADTSHELRTPLTILRAHTDAMRDGVMPLDARGLARLDSAVGDLDRLIADLYQLARADVGMLELRREAMPLGLLFDELATQYREPLRQIGLSLELLPPPDVHLLADPERMRQLFANLLGNAMRYTDAGGKVRISAVADSAKVAIRIEDTAPGVPDGALAHLFERFYRVDVSRSRRGGGSGLGLAICQSIVEAHGGHIAAGHSSLGGLCITVTLAKAEARRGGQ